MADIVTKELEISGQIKSVQAEVDSKEKLLTEIRSVLDEETIRREKLFDKRLQLQSVVKKTSSKLEGVGGVEPHMLEKFKDVSRNVLGKELQKTNKKMKKFDNINQKALDQFVTFTEEHEILQDRHNALVADKTRILDLINVLDNKKSEQVLYTFRQLCKNFKHIFSQVVPG